MKSFRFDLGPRRSGRPLRTRDARGGGAFVPLALGLAVALAGSVAQLHPSFLGTGDPVSLAMCEQAVATDGTPRPECQGSDVRFQADPAAGASRFGFALATGDLNGDDFIDLVVGDPQRNTVSVFFGRASVARDYGLNPTDLAARAVSAGTQADVILVRDPFPGQVGSFGFSIAIGRENPPGACAAGPRAAALVIGAPGSPGTSGNDPGTVFYLPAGALCFPATSPPAAARFDPADLGQVLQSPDAAPDDEFGYAVALGRLLEGTGTHEDVIVGARGARGGAGTVIALRVANGIVDLDPARRLAITGAAGEGLGEVLAVGDLDRDFNPTSVPFGGRDDIALGAVGGGRGKVLLVRGPLNAAGAIGSDGLYREGVDPQIRSLVGEAAGDFFGYSAAVGADGRLAIGSVFADNKTPGSGGDSLTNVASGGRTNCGKVFVWNAGAFANLGVGSRANTANLVVVGRRSGDQLGSGVAFGDFDGSGAVDLVLTARREDGSGLKINEIDRGTAYVALAGTTLRSPADLNRCPVSSDCTGTDGIDVMVFGGDRSGGLGDEMGFAVAAGNFNHDSSDDLFLSSLQHSRVYAVTLEDTDDDRATEGRNIRDEDDDEDGDLDLVDCAPTNPQAFSGGTETTCNGVDENCNGMADDAPDADHDTFDVCGPGNASNPDGKAVDCNDNDPATRPGAASICDGNDNACSGSVPLDERDADSDGYVVCTGWNDVQGDNPAVLGGGDCRPTDPTIFPFAAPKEAVPAACMRDRDGDDYGDPQPPSGVTPGTDCDDNPTTGAAVFPGAAPKEANPGACRRDVDGDDYGDKTAPAGGVAGTDCSDTDAASHPGAPEICDGNDNDCDGNLLAGESDADGDKRAACDTWADPQGDDADILGGGDCDDTSAVTFPGAAPGEAFATACMRDEDGDDFGDLTPPAGVIPGTDCDDAPGAGATTFPGAAQVEAPLNCMKDSDDDGYGDRSVSLPVVRGTDCDDVHAGVHPGRPEIQDDGIDQDCSGFDRITCFVDVDEDHFGSAATVLVDDGDCTDPGEAGPGGDCNDADVTVHPGAPEIVGDGLDQDCSGTDTILCFVDADHDGFGTTLGTTTPAADGSCDALQGEASGAGDCNDADVASHPGATERCDGNDNACAGAVPAGERDTDGDRWVACAGWSDTQGDDPAILGGGDCQPADPATSPGAAPKEAIPGACRRDADGDDYGDLQPPAGVAPGTDCDDAAATGASTFPGAAQIEAPLNCMRDVDDDGYGDAGAAFPVVRGADCDDADAGSRPGGVEKCDGNDNDCDGVTPLPEVDSDGDHYVRCAGWADAQGDDPGIVGSGECDETSALTFPGAAPNEPFASACMRDEDGDGYGDQTPPAGVTPGTDCDDTPITGVTTFLGAAEIEAPFNCMKDADGDGYGDRSAALPVVRGTDCDDGQAGIHPGAPEVPADGIDQNCDGTDMATCFADNDLDGFGGSTPIPPGDADCTDPGESPFGTDCDDANALVHPGAAEIRDDGIDQDCNGEDTITCFVDADHDGFGTSAGTTTAAPDGSCNPAQGEAPSAGDCNDANPAVRPGATDVPDDGIDQDCSGADTVTCFADGDGDGFGAAQVPAADGDCDDPGESASGNDCNDANAAIFPGAPEIPVDGIDQDCNGSDLLTCFLDVDADGFGRTTAVPPIDGDCTDPNESPFNTDCNDTNPAIHPGATEIVGDGIDQDCNGKDTIDCIVDADRDGFGTSLGTTTAAADGSCDTAQRESAQGGDCDDADATVHPGAAEIPDDGVDQNCSGTDTVTCFADADADGFGSTATVLAPDGECLDSGESSTSSDCDDEDDSIHPGAAEVPDDGIDQDCNGADTITCIVDADGDGFGTDAGTTTLAPDGSCDAAQGESATSDDCDDADPAISPGAAEVPDDGIDQDCSGADAVTCFVDADGDGYGGAATVLATDGDCTDPGEAPAGTDCNDAAASIHPGAAEIPNDGIDQDCDGADLGLCFIDSDHDGFGGTSTVAPADGDCTDPGESSFNTDCNDGNPAIHPGAAEIVGDGIDQDCSGSDTITCFVDLDRDGFGTTAGTTTTAPDGSCDRAQQESANSNDCDDGNAAIFPGAAEAPNDGIDQDCNGTDLTVCYVDVDRDGFGGTGTVPPTDGDCTDPGESSFNTDCNDADPTVFPGATDTPDDGIDQDCSGTDTTACILDADRDGSGTAVGTTRLAPDGSCDTAQQESTNANDCDDADPATHPGASEACDGNDNDCSGTVPAGEVDQDGDRYVACAGWSDTQGDQPSVAGGGDCAPADADAFPGAAPSEVFATACMRDRDGDGFGDLAPPPGVTRGSDCDDHPATGGATFPGAAEIDGPLNCMRDDDGDGYGDAAAALPVVPGSDCDDDRATTFPGAPDPPGDGIDQNCNGTDSVTCFRDLDGDGFGSAATIVAADGDCSDAGESAIGGDCNDGNAAIHPGAAETPLDGIDQDCDGADLLVCFVDGDGDGYGTTATLPPGDMDCTDPGESPFSTDCNDAATSIHPGAAEIPNDGIDQNCNGADTITCIVDADHDGFGTELGTTTLAPDGVCHAAQGESTSSDDCDDADPGIHPGAAEIPSDGIDQNCDGTDTAICFVDGDLDGYGGPATVASADGDCADPGESPVSSDCDDGDPDVRPGAPETPDDGIDQNCNGADTITCILDADRDGFGTALGTTTLAPDGTCDTSQRESASAGDCNDAAASVHPGASEIPDDDIDQNCNGADTITCKVDADHDGYGTTLGTTTLAPDGVCDAAQGESATADDCNDANASIHPGAPEVPLDGIDQDCNGSDLMNCFVDADIDGFGGTTTVAPGDGDCVDPGESLSSTDCNDANDQIYPGAPETPNDGIDQDCNGADTVTCFVDGDLDGFGGVATQLSADGDCTDSGESALGTDCNDANSAIHPGATEVCNDGIDQDCNGSDASCVLPFTALSIAVEWPDRLTWTPVDATMTGFSVYRGDLATLRATGLYTQDPAAVPSAARFCGIAGPALQDAFAPEIGKAVFYLVAYRTAAGESGLGSDSGGAPRLNSRPCPASP